MYKKARHFSLQTTIKIVATIASSVDSLTKNKFLKNGSSEQVFWFCWLVLIIIFLIVHISFQVVPAIYGASQRYHFFYYLNYFVWWRNESIHSHIDMRILTFVYCQKAIWQLFRLLLKFQLLLISRFRFLIAPNCFYFTKSVSQISKISLIYFKATEPVLTKNHKHYSTVYFGIDFLLGDRKEFTEAPIPNYMGYVPRNEEHKLGGRYGRWTRNAYTDAWNSMVLHEQRQTQKIIPGDDAKQWAIVPFFIIFTLPLFMQIMCYFLHCKVEG